MPTTFNVDPRGVYTAMDFAAYLQCAGSSVYQSIPGSRCRPKLGRQLPEPMRFGRLVRWTGQQLIDFATPPSSPIPQKSDGSVNRVDAKDRTPVREREGFENGYPVPAKRRVVSGSRANGNGGAK